MEPLSKETSEIINLIMTCFVVIVWVVFHILLLIHTVQSNRDVGSGKNTNTQSDLTASRPSGRAAISAA